LDIRERASFETFVHRPKLLLKYATSLARATGAAFVPLVLFEDPDIMELRIARLKNVHLLNTTAWLLTLHREGLLPEALELIEKINATRKTPLVLFEKVGVSTSSFWLSMFAAVLITPRPH
jgi:hypothetical protein